MLHIDGSQGEGGGQILRTALSMAMVTGTDISIENIRAGRRKPGLMRQHLTCLQAAQAVSNAKVSGAEIGSTAIEFKPGDIQAGDYEFSVGTAGSTMLVFQTVLPALSMAKETSRIKFSGGTHNSMAPSFDFIQLSFAPLAKMLGVTLDMKLHRHGFYPHGGGEWEAVITPTGPMEPLELVDSGNLLKQEAVITSADLPSHIAAREIDEIQKRTGWSDEAMRVNAVTSCGSGNLVSLRLQYENCCEVIEHVGKFGLSAERVARKALKDLRRYQSSPAPVGEHLADQLLLPMAMAGSGVFRTLKPSLHTRTNRDVLHMFMEKRIEFTEIAADLWEVCL